MDKSHEEVEASRQQSAPRSSLTRTHSISLTQQEYADLLAWIDEHGYKQQDYENLTWWRHRTRLISYAYAQIEEMAHMGHAQPASAAECERIMVDEYGSHCADPSEHSEP